LSQKITNQTWLVSSQARPYTRNRPRLYRRSVGASSSPWFLSSKSCLQALTWSQTCTLTLKIRTFSASKKIQSLSSARSHTNFFLAKSLALLSKRRLKPSWTQLLRRSTLELQALSIFLPTLHYLGRLQSHCLHSSTCSLSRRPATANNSPIDSLSIQSRVTKIPSKQLSISKRSELNPRPTFLSQLKTQFSCRTGKVTPSTHSFCSYKTLNTTISFLWK